MVGVHRVHQSTYHSAETAAFAVITPCYNIIAISLTFQRDSGVLKRAIGTSLPVVVYMAARVLQALQDGLAARRDHGGVRHARLATPTSRPVARGSASS